MDNFDFSLLRVDGNFKTSLGEQTRSYKPSEQCHLCLKVQKNFYCKNCVKNGDFIHSTSRFAERFADKRSRLLWKQSEKKEIATQYEKVLLKPKLIESKKEEIRNRKECIKILELLIFERRQKLERRKYFLDERNNENQRRRTLSEMNEYIARAHVNAKRNERCGADLRRCVDRVRNRELPLRAQLDALRPRLKQLIRKRIRELTDFVFPIGGVRNGKTSLTVASDSREDIRNELAEATRTAYIRGRWVFTDSWGESQHSVAGPTLPDSGDYSPYLHWISANQDLTAAMTSSTDVDHNPAYNLCAALTYTTQLVNIIAHYLDVRLPNRLSYSEFSEKTLNERRFVRCVQHLNANVLFLCLSQSVDPALLHPAQTIRNILLLLDIGHSDLGRQDVVEVDAQCVSFFEEQLTLQMREATARLSISDAEEESESCYRTDMVHVMDTADDEEYDSDHLSTDWEAVPLVSCPEASPGSGASSGSSRRLTLNSATVQTTSIAGGLVTSAAASLASMWRGWTNK